MKMYPIRGLCAALGLAAVFSCPVSTCAQSNFNSYSYDEWDGSVAAPPSYQPITALNGLQIGSGAFNVPQDFFMDGGGTLYLADTGNNRIVLMDEELNYLGSIETVKFDGEDIPLTDVEGIYVADDGTIYAAQTSVGRVLIFKDGVVVNTIEKPVSNLIADDFVFSPTKVSVDMYGRVYVLSRGCYSGLLQFDLDGSFMGFFGANKVEVTADVLFNYMWKSLLSDEQRAAMTSILPIEYSNVDCSRDGFVYTSTVGTQLPKSQVKKLNPQGNNIYFGVGNAEINFGDEEFAYTRGNASYPSFIDVKVNGEDFIFGVDLTSGRVFERDQDGNLVGVFGGMGNQLGTFTTPVAVEVFGHKVYVLDRLKNNITVFEPTEYGAMVERAIVLYNDGFYEEAGQAWAQVQSRNANYTQAYSGLGKVYAQEEDYPEALEQLSHSGDRYSYSRSFAKNRLVLVRRYGPAAVGVLIVLIVAIRLFGRIKKRRAKQ